MFRTIFNPWREVERSKATFYSYVGASVHSIILGGLCGHLAYIAFKRPPQGIPDPLVAFLEALPAAARPYFEKLANVSKEDPLDHVRNWKPLESIDSDRRIAGVLDDIMESWILSNISYARLELAYVLKLAWLNYIISVAKVLFCLMLNDFALLALYINRSGHVIFIHFAGLLHVLASLVLACVSLAAYFGSKNRCIAAPYAIAWVYLWFMGIFLIKVAWLTSVKSSQFKLEKRKFQDLERLKSWKWFKPWTWFKPLEWFKPSEWFNPLPWIKLLRNSEAIPSDEEKSVGMRSGTPSTAASLELRLLSSNRNGETSRPSTAPSTTLQSGSSDGNGNDCSDRPSAGSEKRHKDELLLLQWLNEFSDLGTESTGITEKSFVESEGKEKLTPCPMQLPGDELSQLNQAKQLMRPPDVHVRGGPR